MKYIIIERQEKGLTRSYPVIFPNLLIHKDVADNLLNGVLTGGKVTSGGDVNSFEIISAYGKSTSLGLESNEKDGEFIRMSDYNGGLR